ncbi:gamma-glutamylcyclotransferase family protein [Achromobacter sp.]|uniref:gamma-glutamylcyclotransferase family protein n=1 Tax=Achromobacter sp. TaxID=134375 RepID=UPI0031D49F79
MSIYVFVYGTLRAGEINDLARAAAARGLPAASHVGAASVPGMLVDFGDWPGLIPVQDGRRVRGDVFQVEPALIALMDEIEEYQPGKPCCFVRRTVTASLEGAGPTSLLPCEVLSDRPRVSGRGGRYRRGRLDCSSPFQNKAGRPVRHP